MFSYFLSGLNLWYYFIYLNQLSQGSIYISKLPIHNQNRYTLESGLSNNPVLSKPAYTNRVQFYEPPASSCSDMNVKVLFLAVLLVLGPVLGLAVPATVPHLLTPTALLQTFTFCATIHTGSHVSLDTGCCPRLLPFRIWGGLWTLKCSQEVCQTSHYGFFCNFGVITLKMKNDSDGTYCIVHGPDIQTLPP